MGSDYEAPLRSYPLPEYSSRDSQCVLFCPVDTGYWCDPIRRIKLASASIVVEIDLTWSLGFCFQCSSVNGPNPPFPVVPLSLARFGSPSLSVALWMSLWQHSLKLRSLDQIGGLLMSFCDFPINLLRLSS
ncbi:hypothetical protein Tco_0227905 [Tanacetum coccineum]